jgi:hypothetical protein
MKFSRKLTHAVVAIACIGMVVPQAILAAPQAVAPAVKARDVSLNAAGGLSGVVLTSQAKPIAGTPVTLLKGKDIVATVFADKEGKFAFDRVKSGSYVIAVREGADNKVTPIRVWKAEAAPANAARNLAFVSQNAVRGQDEYYPPQNGVLGGLDIITLWTLTASTGALVLSAINLSEINDVNDKLDTIVSP